MVASSTKSFADDRELALGFPLPVERRGGESTRRCARSTPWTAPGSWQGDHRPPAFDAAFPRPRKQFTFVDVGDGASVADRGNRRALPRREAALGIGLRDEPDQEFSTILNLFYVLLAFSVVVSLSGMV